MSTRTHIIEKLEKALSPQHLEVIDESHMHNVPADGESHFKVIVISNEFNDKMLVARHRLINKTLSDELSGTIHALALHTMTPDEWAEKGAAPNSPECMGSNK